MPERANSNEAPVKKQLDAGFICQLIVGPIFYAGHFGFFGFAGYSLEPRGLGFAYFVTVWVLWAWILLAFHFPRYCCCCGPPKKRTSLDPPPWNGASSSNHTTSQDPSQPLPKNHPDSGPSDIATPGNAKEIRKAFARSPLARKVRRSIFIKALYTAVIPGCLLLGLYSLRLASNYSLDRRIDDSWSDLNCNFIDRETKIVTCAFEVASPASGIVAVCWLFLDVYLTSDQVWRRWRKRALSAGATEMATVRIVSQ